MWKEFVEGSRFLPAVKQARKYTALYRIADRVFPNNASHPAFATLRSPFAGELILFHRGANAGQLALQWCVLRARVELEPI